MRNREVIRQWNLLLRIEAARMGVSVDDLAKEMGVTKRTIWRDVEALQHAGFPLADEIRDRKTIWKLTGMPLKVLNDPSLSVSEVCSLYMSRALVMSMAGTAFASGVTSVFKKLHRALSPKMREFLDQLPGVIKVKAVPAKRRNDASFEEIVACLIEASMGHRAVTLKYFSASSNREKDYELHPYTVSYADGGLYLTAYVPEYRQVRTFAMERVRKVVVLNRSFEPSTDLAGEPFGHSLGVNRGKPERVELEFAARLAPHIRDRDWHPSQRLQDLPDGGVRMTLRVCRDYALRQWILGFGPLARVIAPQALAEEILEQLEEARDAYAPRFEFETPDRMLLFDHPKLPGLPS